MAAAEQSSNLLALSVKRHVFNIVNLQFNQHYLFLIDRKGFSLECR
jgi:hypothetical protein